jgi:lysophospholipase
MASVPDLTDGVGPAPEVGQDVVMAKKRLRSAAGAAEDQLKAGAKRLQAQLGTVEKVAGKLATRAKERLPAPSDVKPDLPGVHRRLQKATASVKKRKPPRDEPTASAAPPAAASSTASAPDDSWTVADLRAEAKKRGLTGYSRKTKAELLTELRG